MTVGDVKYVYLDWNVFKYMKEPRPNKNELDNQFKEKIFELKKKYKFPFSCAHIEDRANHYLEEHEAKVKEDFKFIETITDSLCVTIYNDKLMLHKQSIEECFDDILKRKKEENNNINFLYSSSNKIDMEKLDKDHPMYNHLKSKQGILFYNAIENFVQDIFLNNDKYKSIKNYIKKIDLKNDFNLSHSCINPTDLTKLLWHLGPFIDSLRYDKETLKNKWLEIIEKWVSLNNNPPFTRDLLLICGYMLLDMHPLFKEKMKNKKNTLDNILRDGNHCFYASSGRYFVSEDDGTRKKTSFLYNVYNIKTKVVCEQEFINFFT